MDQNTFDGFARLLGGAATRRAALGALLGGVGLGSAGLTANAKPKRRKKRRKRRATVCYGALTCEPPGPGKDFDSCDFSGSSVFVDAYVGGSSFRGVNLANAVMDRANLQGTMFRNANLAGASLKNVDVRGAGFPGACLLDTDLTGFIIAEGEAPFALSFVCRTRVGEFIENRDCNRLPACCRR